MDAPRRLVVTSPFGQRIHPVYKTPDWHNGVDLAVPAGTWLRAPLDGQAHPSVHSEGGNQVVIEGYVGRDHWRVGYAHLQGPGRSGPVTKGDVVGESGRTGVGTGAHVHITTKLNGQYVDPLQVLDLRAFEVVRG